MVTTVKCPTCGADVRWVAENTWRPFCSGRCKQIDLGAWADEKYTVPATGQTEHGEEGELP